MHPAPILSFSKQLWGIHLVQTHLSRLSETSKKETGNGLELLTRVKTKRWVMVSTVLAAESTMDLPLLRLRNKPPIKPFLKRKKKKKTFLRAVFSSPTYCRCFPLFIVPSYCLRCSKLSHFWGEAIPKVQDSGPLILPLPLPIFWASNMKKSHFSPWDSGGTCPHKLEVSIHIIKISSSYRYRYG